jgi:hypothetical protein
VPPACRARHAQAHVAAADDQQALAAKARWQRAEGFGLKAKWKAVFSREVFTHCKRQAQQQPLPVTAAKDNQNVMTEIASSTHQISVQPSGRQFATQGAETILAAAIRSGVACPMAARTAPAARASARSSAAVWCTAPTPTRR